MTVHNRTGLPVKVLLVELDAPLAPISLDRRYRSAVLVVTLRGRVVGHVEALAQDLVTEEAQRDALVRQLHRRLPSEVLRDAFWNATRGSPEPGPPGSPTVSVVVRTSGSPDADLRRCIRAVRALNTRALEVIVVDVEAADAGARGVCAQLGVRYLTRDAVSRYLREANSELVALTTDTAAPDPRWLDRLGVPFADALVVATAGYVGPLELETRGQVIFEAYTHAKRIFERAVFDGFSTPPTIGAARAGWTSNLIARREWLQESDILRVGARIGVQGHAQELCALYRALASGYRIVADPARIVWARSPRSIRETRQAIFEDSAHRADFAVRCLVRHREPAAAWLPATTTLRRLSDLVANGLRANRSRFSLGVVAPEVAGTLTGPFRYLRAPRPRITHREPLDDVHPSEPRPPAVVRPAAPPVSIVIPSYNRRERLGEVLHALAAQTYPAERLQVTVVIDGSEDGSAELVRSLQLPYRLELVEQDNRGLAAARNRGALEATEPVLVFLDDDIVPEADFVAEHAVAHLRAPDDVVMIGYCRAVIEDDSLWAFVVRAEWEDYYRNMAQPDYQWTSLDFSVGGNVSLARSLFVSSGGFDERFRRRQERELGIRMLERGVRFEYQASIRGRHYFDPHFETKLRQTRREASLDVVIGRKHPHAKARLLLAGMTRPNARGMSARAFLAYRYPEESERVARAALSLLDALEAARLRKPWLALTAKLLGHAYLLGLRDALPEHEQFLEFVGPVSGALGEELIAVDLAQRGLLRIPIDAGPIRLDLRYRGAPVKDVLAKDPGGPWKWDDAAARVQSALSRTFAERVGSDELLHLARSLSHP